MPKKARFASDLMEDSSLASALLLTRTIFAENCAAVCLAKGSSFPALLVRAKDVQIPPVPDKETGCALR
jgi:hypothetical protein